MKKILVVLTNVSRYHGTEEPTGLWLGEATEFVEEVTKAGLLVPKEAMSLWIPGV